MKKSILNIALTTALSSVIFSGSALSTQAYANDTSVELSSTNHAATTDNNNSNDITTETYMYPGIGVGAATGALVAGPVGLLVGGLVGAFAGASQSITTENNTTTAEQSKNPDTALSANKASHVEIENTFQDNKQNSAIQLAQIGTAHSMASESIEPQDEKLVDILTTDISFDIYFRSGSSDVESFYPARLTAVSQLLNTIDNLELHLDGYSDRRGDKSKNIALAKKRIEKVREQLIAAGVDANRINSKAFGEMKMVSAAGDLEAYTFDRKVVIRFQRATSDSLSTMASALSNFETEDTLIVGTNENVSDESNTENTLIVNTSSAF